MTTSKSMTLSLIAAGLFTGLLAVAPAEALTYRVTEADRDRSATWHRGGHAFWMPDRWSRSTKSIPNGYSSRFVFKNDSGRLHVSDDMTTAHLTGTIQAAGKASSVWDVDIKFFLGMDYDNFSDDHVDPNGDTHDGRIKKELYRSKYADRGGPVDPSTWRFFYMDESQATLTRAAGSAYEGDVLNLYQRPDGRDYGKYVFQMGEGANGKNLNFGFSGWFGYTSEAQEQQGQSSYYSSYCYNKEKTYKGIGDINVDLEPIPEPVSAGLTMMGLGALALTTRRRKV